MIKLLIIGALALFPPATFVVECGMVSTTPGALSTACPTVTCQVSAWSTWGNCSIECGSSGTRTRTRSKTVQESCGGQCFYSLSETADCADDGCNGHGSPMAESCECDRGWSGTCCDKEEAGECSEGVGAVVVHMLLPIITIPVAYYISRWGF
ncbi:uncharacterized protein LOC144438253 [Glandiceps talaboti]